MNNKKNVLVEIENGVRLFVQSFDGNLYYLSIEKDGEIVKTVSKESVRLTNPSLVWFNLSNGEFSDSWKEDSKATNRASCLLDFEHIATITNDKIKLIEFTCLNDEKFEFSHMMKVR